MPPPPSNNPMTTQQVQQIQDLLLSREGIFTRAFGELGKQLSALGMQGITGVADLAQAVYSQALSQAQEYESDIVDVFGDISTQQEAYGKSIAKLGFERRNDLRQDFLQIEAGGIKLMDVFKDLDAAAADAMGIIGELPGASGQFTDDLQKQNLTIIQLLKKAAGLSKEQTGAIMKIAKARGEDSKQMLADIGTFSKILSDKFGLDTKKVAQNVAEITTMTSTFGKVSIEAATAAAAKFEALGVTIDDVAGSIGSTFGSFSGAADAAAKLSQVFGVNIDAMQMMVDVNSGPDGMLRALDNMRESLIGAGVDASELSAPLRRLIKDMTGVRDDATIESLFDPDRISVETDEIIEASRKAAEAQKDPLAAINFLDKDIAKVRRSLAEIEKLTSDQAIARIGTSATKAAVAFSDFSSSTTTAVDSFNQLITMMPKVDQAIKSGVKIAETGAKVADQGVQALDEVVKNTAVKETGRTVESSTAVNYGQYQDVGRGAAFDPAFQQITGYTPSDYVMRQAQADLALKLARETALKALGEKQSKSGKVTPATQQELDKSLADLQAAMLNIGVDLSGVMQAIGIGVPAGGGSSGGPTPGPGGSIPAASASPAAPAQPDLNRLTSFLNSSNFGLTPPPAAAAAPGAAVGTATPGPGSAIPYTGAAPATAVSPVAGAPAVAAPPTSTGSAPAGAPAPVPSGAPAASRTTGATASAPVRTAGGAAGTASATASGNVPVNINLNVTLDAGATATALAKYGGLATTTP